MGVKPSAAATAVVASKPVSGSDTPVPIRFGTSHACVIVACIVTAAVLAELGMSVQHVLALLAGAGSIGAAAVVIVVTCGRQGTGRIGRFVHAYLNSGS